MTAPWPVEMRAEQLVLELREILVRFDENLAAHHLMQHCVPYFLDDASHPAIAKAREDQAAMVDHIVGESYQTYYETNHHERPFEEQYQMKPELAHEGLHRVRYLRRWLEERRKPGTYPDLLDVACNDGWMAVNLHGLACYTGIDLNPHCLKRAKDRGVGTFFRGFAEDAFRITKGCYDVVVAFELIEHVKDPAALLDVMAACCKPGGSMFVSTPLGAGTGGDLPNWWFVEPKGHVRAFTPQSFGALLSRHGVTHIEISDTQGAGQLMVARVDTAEIGETNASKPVSANGTRRQSDSRSAGRSHAAQR